MSEEKKEKKFRRYKEAEAKALLKVMGVTVYQFALWRTNCKEWYRYKAEHESLGGAAADSYCTLINKYIDRMEASHEQ